MKMPKAVQLPSGSWRVSVMVQGRRVSVTAATKRQAEQDAAAIKIGAKSVPSKNDMTVGAAIDRYIESKDTVLSPSTVNGYRKLRKSVLQDLMDEPAANLSLEKVQRAVNRMAK